ncbi:MBL fold metallo-hydrolase [Waterburya agarophytonicola K14]|uniref:MBL fold metallo-hydrolase n=1 Tax=Waterburya agarophytonicola KI4 TaxID=2874699 RepID=A0A964BP66_9CYAN|nr:MBL fold metallo-hydrolase [Waterburya agarophytonicola]MCC0177019.1 MBL fold metallo-hydrolase [Waterburya agarophytonicola KI4]
MPQNSTKINHGSSLNIKSPRLILPGIFAFAPNRDTLGATSYFIVDKIGNILLDCPAWNETNQKFLIEQGGVSSLIITHRGGIGKNVIEMQKALSCEVILQEQEAYLLPEIEVNSFAENLTIGSDLELIWTCGHSPGSSCLYSPQQGGILFTGRHLLPKSPTEIVPLRTAKTFHWWRQLNSINKLCDRFTPDTLQYILPGANTGYLRGKGYIDLAYEKLSSLDLTALHGTTE